MGNNNKRKATRREIAEQERAERERREKNRVRLITAGVLAAVLVVVGGIVALTAGGDSGSTAADKVVATDATPPGLTDGAIVTGTGPVELTLYEDLQCPACKAFEAQTGSTIEQLQQQGAITVKRHVIAFLDRASTTDYSTRALNALGCVLNAKASVAPAYISTLFTDQPEEGSAGLTDARLNELATAAGSPDVSSCITALTYKGWTQKQTQAAADANVDSTPTVLVNGKPLEDRSPDGLRAAVQAAA